MLPKRLKRVRLFQSGALEAREVMPGMFSIQGKYDVRHMDDYFKSTGLYTPRDWSSVEQPQAQPVPEAHASSAD